MRLTYEEWVEKYRPIDSGNGYGFDTHDDWDRLSKYDGKQIWTLVDDGGCYIVAGCHRINRLEYYVTEVPWESEDLYI